MARPVTLFASWSQRPAVRCSSTSPKRLPARVSSTSAYTSLLSVPGIGKRAQDRLRNADVDSVAALCDLYVEEHGRKREELIKYLKV
jgi:predicted RecB family nuclease